MFHFFSFAVTYLCDVSVQRPTNLLYLPYMYLTTRALPTNSQYKLVPTPHPPLALALVLR
jgi:hypothetical protein